MSKTNKRPRFVTPAGIAQYPYLTTPDTKFNPDGDYKVNLEIDPTEITTFLDEQHEAAVAAAKKDNPGKKIKEGDVPYSVNDETGKVTVRFKLKAKVHPKNGESFDQRPALFDAKGKPLGKDVKIGGGSKIKVSYEVLPYYTAIAGAGISLRLKAVQVIDLVEYSSGGSGESYGFGKEDGYEATEETTNEFTDESQAETEDF